MQNAELQNDRILFCKGTHMRMPVKKLIIMAVLTAAALIIFIIEAQVPLPIPVPGVKLGLANAVTLFALFYGRGAKQDTRGSVHLTTSDAFMILVCRIILGALFTGRILAFFYSITGGLLGFAAQALVKRYVSVKQIWVCGAIGAIFHNVGQILAAIIVTGTPAIAAYLPILIIAGVITGIVTGLVAQITLSRIR